VNSNSGDVTLQTVFAGGIDVTTGGTIRSLTVASTLLVQCVGACGDIRYTVSGTGRISVTEAFGGDNVYLTSEHGVIVAASTGLIVGRDVIITSVDGKVYL